ncbi:hypothetical protein ENBRE01_2129 [Enteropsectra breve]|nr:hypothetical protein ENBRE01_2129 [Enteropsectra breve]
MARDDDNFFQQLVDFLSGKRGQCLKALYKGNFQDAHTLALDLYEKYPNFLLLSCFFDLKSYKPMFTALIKKHREIDSNFLYVIAKSPEIAYSDVKHFEAQLGNSSFLELAIRKQLFLKKYRETSSENCLDGIAEELNDLISKISDWELFQFAIDNNIEIRENNSINYKWYRVSKHRESSAAAYIMQKNFIFSEIKTLNELCGEIKSESVIHRILLEYIKSGTADVLIKEMLDIYENDKSFAVVKLLISLLIATRNENNMVLALFFARSHSFEENYEIDLIELFILRHFCMIQPVLAKMKKMDIKNVQIYNTAYIWLDPMIVTGKFIDRKIADFVKAGRAVPSTMRIQVKDAMEQDKIGCAASTINMIKYAENHISLCEAEKLEIVAKESKTCWSELLGDGCSFLFDKIVVGHKRSEEGTLDTLYNKGSMQNIESVFENKFEYAVSEEFKNWFMADRVIGPMRFHF